MKTLALLNHGRDGSPLPSLIKSGTRTESRPYLHKESAGGMVLFEVMIALFVFTMAAFSLVVALSGCLDAAAQRNQVDIALHGLSNQLALLHGSSIQPGETDAPDDGTGVGYHVSVLLQQDLRDQKGLPIPNTYRATITATWKSSNGELQTRNVSELIYQP